MPIYTVAAPYPWITQSGFLDSRAVVTSSESPRFAERRYSTHIQVRQTGTGYMAASFIWGHYDLTLEEAVADIQQRQPTL